VTGLYMIFVGVGAALIVVAVVWSFRTRRTRKLWRSTRHDASRAAIVLELEEKVRELEARAHETRELDAAGRR